MKERNQQKIYWVSVGVLEIGHHVCFVGFLFTQFHLGMEGRPGD